MPSSRGPIQGRRAGELMLERSRSQRCEDPDAFVSGIEALVDEALSAGLMLENLKVGQLLMRVYGNFDVILNQKNSLVSQLKKNPPYMPHAPLTPPLYATRAV